MTTETIGIRLLRMARAVLYFVVGSAFDLLVIMACFFQDVIVYVIRNGAVPDKWRDMWSIPPVLTILPIPWEIAMTVRDAGELAVIAALGRFEGISIRDLIPVKGAQPWLTCLGCVIAGLMVRMVMPASHPRAGHALAGDGPDASLIAASIGFALVTGLTEEFLHRGLLLHMFAKSSGFIVATLMTTVLFSVLHPRNMYPATILLSLLYAWTTRRSGSITPGILAHSATNAMSTLAVAHLLPPWFVPPPLAFALTGTALLAIYVGTLPASATADGV